jgi:uncharacterized protein YjbI with pentapeptide repeats
LLKIVKISKNLKEVKLDDNRNASASNSISILNASKFNFKRQDFEGIKIPHGNLNNSCLEFTNLQYSDLRRINISNANLNNSNLNFCNLEGA